MTRDASPASGPGLRSARLVLRPASCADVAMLHSHWNRPPVRRYLWDDQPVPHATVAAVLAHSDADFHAFGFGAWIMEDPATEAFVGYCGLRMVADLEVPELLCSLEPAHWRQGLATEGAATVLAYAWHTLGFTRVIGEIDEHNEASRRVLERLGGQPIGARPLVRDRRPARYYEVHLDTAPLT